MAVTRYIARAVLSHSRTGALIQPGQEADVSHLTPDELLMLLSMPVPPIEAAPEMDETPEPAQPEPEED